MPDLSQYRSSGHANGRKVALREVASRDAIAITARLLIIMAWLMMAVIVFSISAQDRRPKESPGEIALGILVVRPGIFQFLTQRM